MFKCYNLATFLLYPFVIETVPPTIQTPSTDGLFFSLVHGQFLFFIHISWKHPKWNKIEVLTLSLTMQFVIKWLGSWQILEFLKTNVHLAFNSLNPSKRKNTLFSEFWHPILEAKGLEPHMCKNSAPILQHFTIIQHTVQWEGIAAFKIWLSRRPLNARNLLWVLLSLHFWIQWNN